MLKTSSRKIKHKSNKLFGKYDRNTTMCSYLMLSIDIIGFLVFVLYPLAWAIRLSWFSYTGTPSSLRFIGWTNFINIFKNDLTYWKTFLTTIQFAFYKIPIEIPLALFVANLLTKKLKGSGFFRTMFILPNVISIAIVGLIFSNMFSYFGVMNNFFESTGLLESNMNWFSTKFAALTVLVIADTWHSIGINILYFISALSNISDDLYEAAKIDGANAWQRFFHVTVPGIAPVLQIILMMSIIGTVHTSDIVLVLTGGAPAGQTFTVMPYLTNTFVPGFANEYVNIGYGCALAVTTAIILALITLLYNKLSSKLSDVN